MYSLFPTVIKREKCSWTILNMALFKMSLSPSRYSFVKHFWTRTPNHQLGEGGMIDEPLNEMRLMRMQILQSRGSPSQLVDNNYY